MRSLPLCRAYLGYSSSHALQHFPTETRLLISARSATNLACDTSLRAAFVERPIAFELCRSCIDASTGAHLWAERFEGSIDRIFDLQDQVTEKIVGAIAPKLQWAETERVRRKPTQSLDAYDYFLRGTASFYLLNKEGIEEAIGLFRKAIDIDPGYASACGMTALCYIRRKASRSMADEKWETSEALQFARRAVELGPEDAIALSTGGFGLAYLGGELDDGTTFIDRAIELSPNLASGFIFSGWTRILLGDQETAIKHFKHSNAIKSARPVHHVLVCGYRFCASSHGRRSRSCLFGANGFPHAAEILLH